MLLVRPPPVLAVSRAGDVRATVRVEGVVRRKLPGHVVVVIVGGGLEAGGQRVQARGLRRQLTRVGVRSAHDEGERAERRILELVFLQKRIERAAVSDVSELHPRNVVRDGPFTLGDRHDLVGRHEEKRRALVDEPRDQPRTDDAVDARLFPGDPFHQQSPSLLRLDAVGLVERGLQSLGESCRVVVGDRKSTRLNSSHGYISYAVFCLKKKKINYLIPIPSSSTSSPIYLF